jgi:hypothetical protein
MYISPVPTPDAPRKSRSRRIDASLLSLTTASPKSRTIGSGGFGTLCVLPRELRQTIYGYALDVDIPVTGRSCCGPDTTTRERGTCRKHNTGTGRFNVLRLSKAVHEEASWILYSQGVLSIGIDQAIKSYLNGDNPRSLRHMGNSVTQNKNKHKATMWTAAARFRSVRICVPERTLTRNDPAAYTRYLLEVVCLLGREWERRGTADVHHRVSLDLGTIFHEMLPFNMESQTSSKYAELLDWLSNNYPCEEPDFEMIRADSEQNLKKVISMISMYSGHAEWTVRAKTEICETDEGGSEGLRAFQVNCARYGVVFEHGE